MGSNPTLSARLAARGCAGSGGDAVADATGTGRILGKPNASDGSIDFTCSGPTIHQVGSGTITVSGSLTRP